jgi:hypothetical protein
MIAVSGYDLEKQEKNNIGGWERFLDKLELR